MKVIFSSKYFSPSKITNWWIIIATSSFVDYQRLLALSRCFHIHAFENYRMYNYNLLIVCGNASCQTLFCNLHLCLYNRPLHIDLKRWTWALKALNYDTLCLIVVFSIDNWVFTLKKNCIEQVEIRVHVDYKNFL